MNEQAVQTEPVNDVLTAGQQALLNAMPALADIRLPCVRDTVAARTYIDPGRFEAEMRGVFRRMPVLAGPSSLLRQPRSYPAILSGQCERLLPAHRQRSRAASFRLPLRPADR